MEYNLKKQSPQEAGASKGKNCTSSNTAKELAEKHGVSERTIKNDGKYAEAAEKLKEIQPELKEKIDKGEAPPKFAIIKAAAVVEESPEKAKEILKNVHVSNNSGENEWYTPSSIIDRVRKVLGEIDCDPASSEIANKTVKAKKFFTKDNDGLKQKWGSLVFMNPPYAQPLVSNFSEALVERIKSGEVKQACVLVNNATETRWFQNMLVIASAVCFLNGRVKFVDMDGNASGAPLQGQAVLYFGNNSKSFGKIFEDMGHVLRFTEKHLQEFINKGEKK